jgi:hypothetical protein
MGRPFIVLGDSTSHGGTVVGASGSTDTHGRRIARVGDQVTCPKKGHGTTVIVSGDPTMIIDGRARRPPWRQVRLWRHPHLRDRRFPPASEPLRGALHTVTGCCRVDSTVIEQAVQGMARILKALGLGLVIATIVWLVTLWQWQNAERDIGMSDIVVQLIVLPAAVDSGAAGRAVGCAALANLASCACSSP